MMAEQTHSPVVGRRYVLRGLLGQGGMGAVYRAFDRLTGQEVALKRVAHTADGISTTAPTEDNALRLSLAQEFRVLASLRHPNIVSVLDYGFDTDRQPFFTMELLDGAQDIFEAAQVRPLEDRLELLVQTLQALVYLHRRGVLHRDLKPSNVLVIERLVKVVDFGLALFENLWEDSALGTLPYLPPELLSGSAPDERSDLYAIGLIAYEILLGAHPFETENRGHLINNILNKAPDLSALPPELRMIVGRLLMKQPDSRYSRAADVILALYRAVDKTLAPETSAMRESFLQAARLIGREAELSQLTQALARAFSGRGEAWLVSGESGVGKTRLLDELRTMALVRGALVVRGQPVSEGASPYSLWRDPLRWLALLSDVDDLAASTLKPIIPDIGALLERAIPDPPPLDPEAAQTRLLAAIESLLQQLKDTKQPLVILLEDLHFAGSESLALINWVARLAPRLPLLVIGSYRDDERPGLPKELPYASRLTLQRLSEEQIRALAVAILGEAGSDNRLIDLLRRETEGNVFFIVEVLRALAEEAGELPRIPEIDFERTLSAGGVMRIMRQRLERLPEHARPLLRAAAVYGARIDLAVLRHLAPDIDIDAWLTECADRVLTVQDERWIFSHSKLRDVLLDELASSERRELHRQIAEAVEAVHDPAQEAAALTYHWAMAGDAAKEGRYALLAGERAYQNGAWGEAITLLKRAYGLREEMGLSALEAARILRLQADASYRQGDLPEARQHLREAAAVIGWWMPDERREQLGIFVRQLLRQTGHRLIPATMRLLKRDREWRLETHRISMLEAEIAFLSNETLPMQLHGVGALNQAESAGVSPELAKASANMCYAIGSDGLHVPAQIYKRQALRAARLVGDPSVEDFALRRTSLYDIGMGNWAEAEQSLTRALNLAETLGDLQSREESLDFLASLMYYRGDFNRSADLFKQVHTSAVRTTSLLHQSWGLLGQGQNALRQGHLEQAESLLKNAVNLLEDRRINDVVTLIQAFGLLAVVELYRGRADAAGILAKSAVERIGTSNPAGFSLLEGYAGATEVYLSALENLPAGHQAERQSLDQQAGDSIARLQTLARKTPIVRPRALLASGWLAWLHGRRQKAHALLRKGLRLADAMQMPFESALIHYHIGRWLDPDDPLRVQHLGQACAVFNRLGCVHQLAVARSALDASHLIATS
jgi:tetratricopeptide (TPR) repeat protein